MMMRLYAWLLRLYPQAFRAQFGEEMQTVFAETLAQATSLRTGIASFLRELRDLPVALINAYQATLLEGGKMSVENQYLSKSTPLQAAIGALPFLAYGIATMIFEADRNFPFEPDHVSLALYTLALIGLLMGWVRGFPLWSYGYLGWVLVLGGSGNISVSGIQWGYQSWVPFGIVILAALLWTRSLNPIKKFFKDIWNDWSRLVLTSFALISWVGLMYDENHHPWMMAFIFGATLAAAGGAWFFLRSGSLKGRIFSVTGSFIAAVVLSSLAWSTGNWRAYYGWPAADPWYQSLGEATPLLLVWFLILFWSVAIGAIHGVARKLQTR